MYNFINSKIFKSILAKIPLIALTLTTLSTNYYYFFNNQYLEIYTLISYCFGFSLASLPAYFFIVYKYKFCLYSKVAVWGLLSYVLINIFWFILDKLFDIKINIYGEVFEGATMSIALFLSLYYLFRGR